MNQMLINVSTRKFRRAVRLPEGDIDAPAGAGVSKPAVSRRLVALSAERLQEWMAPDLSSLDLLIIQIGGIHIKDDLMLLAAVGIGGGGKKHPLGVAGPPPSPFRAYAPPLRRPGKPHRRGRRAILPRAPRSMPRPLWCQRTSR